MGAEGFSEGDSARVGSVPGERDTLTAFDGKSR